jgi:hypothetical protein
MTIDNCRFTVPLFESRKERNQKTGHLVQRDNFSDVSNIKFYAAGLLNFPLPVLRQEDSVPTSSASYYIG